MNQHVVKMSSEIRSGRAGVTVQLHAFKKRVRQLKAEIKNMVDLMNGYGSERGFGAKCE